MAEVKRELCFILSVLTVLILFRAEACTDFQFECGDGECIRSLYRCDLDDDCLDKSDELGCDDITCTDDMFRCTSGRCIPKYFVCDGDSDCPHDDDEPENCTFRAIGSSIAPATTPDPSGRISICESWQFQCHSGACIRGTYQCDDDRDCADASDELGCEPCVITTELKAGGLPFCKVRIYKGTTRIRNETSCVSDDVFNIKTGRKIPYDRRTYSDAKVNYVRISCEAYTPLDFDFDGVGYISQIRILRSRKSGIGLLGSLFPTYITDVTTVATPQATGHFIFTEIQSNTSVTPKSTSLFFYFEKERKPYLIGTERIQKAKRETVGNLTIITFPCVLAKVDTPVQFYQEINNTWTKVEDSQFIYNPLRGFEMNVSNVISGKYKCTTDGTLNSDVDVVTIIVDDDLIHPPQMPKPSNLKIVLSKTELSATCHSIRPDSSPATKFEFVNIYAESPIEAKVLANCVLKGSQNCGSFSHVRNHHPRIDDMNCRDEQRKTQCRHISELYPQGILVCSMDSEYLVQQYFTGLDDKLYTNWRHAPKSALIRIENSSNTTSGMAGSSYSTKCATAGMIFSKNAVIFESRAAGTNLVSKHTSGGYQSYSFTLHENMTELYCADRIWETHQELWSEPIKINVTKRIITCSFLEFKCESGQCIRASYRCDGDKDCMDNSDESDCPTTTSTTTTAPAPSTCSPTMFFCDKSSLLTDFCLPMSYQCDGEIDCQYGEDEDNCPSTTSTTTTARSIDPCERMFKCNNGDCINLNYRCDGDRDCKDGSDESPIADCPTTLPPVSTSSAFNATTEKVMMESTEKLMHEISNKDKTASEMISATDDAKETSDMSPFKITFIVLGVILSVVLLILVSYKVYTKYGQNSSRGISSSSNIKYTNPSCDQEEVLID